MRKILLLSLLGLVLCLPVMADCTCPEGQVWSEANQQCETPGGASWLNFVPKTVWHRVSNGTVEWLTSFFGSSVVLCDTISHNYPLNVWGQPTDGSPENYYSILYSQWNSYGYRFWFEAGGEFDHATYHRVEIPEGMGLYCRTMTTRPLFGTDILSAEFFVE